MAGRSCIHALLVLLLCGGTIAGHAQNAFGDSLASVAGQVRDRLVHAGRTRVAITDVSDPAGNLPAATLTYVEEMLLSRLVQAGGLVVVERRQLDRILEEQHRTASGTFDERGSIELGRLLAADAIIIGRVFQVDKRLHVMLRMLDTGTGELLGSAETLTVLPKGKEPQQAAPARGPAGTTQQRRFKREGPGSERNSIVEMRAFGLGMRHFGRLEPGAAVEVAVRSREQDQGRLVPGRVAIGLQAQLYPGMGQPWWSEPNFDIGHIADLRNDPGFVGTPTVRFGSVDMRQDRLFLLPRDREEEVFLQAITQAGQSGTEWLEYDRYSLSDVRMTMGGFNIPIRWYLGENHIYDNVPKLYMEFGFGMDIVRVQAKYTVTNTLVQLDRSDLTYSVQRREFMADAPPLEGVGSNLLFTHLSIGGGLEIGRFNVFVMGRNYLVNRFQEGGRSFERIRGNILAYPVLAGASDDRRVMSDLQRDGAVPFGAMYLERQRNADPSSGTTGGTVRGNGVDRFWDGGQLLFGVAFRFL